MGQRLGIALAVLLLGAGLAAGVVLVTGGDGDTATTSGTVLTWEQPPLVISPPELPDDRVAYGTVRNSSLERLRASTADFVVRDADGAQLTSSVQFLGNYAHGIYGAFQKPNPLPPEELSRLGFVVDLQTGQTAPLTVSYRLSTGAQSPATLYYKNLPALELPSK
ncbi:MAG: hypothetical protein ABIZ50_05580 [Solirubrobacterales bacterium]